MTPGTEHDRRFHGGADRLRAPQRLALMEVPRVVALCTEGLSITTVLDVGTGSGVFAEAFAADSAAAPAAAASATSAAAGPRRVTGLDPSAELLAKARELVPAAEFLEGTAEEIPCPDKSFDLVFLGHVLHETDRPAAALSEARRVARARVAVLEWPYKDDGQGPPLSHRLEPSRIMALAREAGFTSVERISLSHMDLYRLSP